MTKLTEVATYSPTIFRLETTTPVAGGAVVLDGNDDPIQGHANAQAQLLANRTKYLKTITDALGTAATTDLTTSTTDTTAGRVLKVADFGQVGATSSPGIPSNDCNLALFAGCFAVNGSTLNTPVTAAAGALLLVYMFNGVTGYQTYHDNEAGRTYSRRMGGGVWGGWVAGWYSTGVNTIAADTGSIGYGTGSGGTVIQATSKATGVTLNKPSGRINTAGDALAAGAFVSFVLTNDKITTSDVTVVQGNLANYQVEVFGINAGFVSIRIKNITGGSLAEVIAINFIVIKGAIA